MTYCVFLEGLIRGKTFFLVGLAVLACRSAEQKRGQTTDVYVSPYREIVSSKVQDAAEADEKGSVSEALLSRLHPAAKERPYHLVDLETLAADNDEKQLLEWMRQPKKGPDVLKRVVLAGERGKRWLRKALKCADRNVRIQACLVYGNLRGKVGKEDVSALVDALLLDPDPDVRATAAKAFVAIKSRDAVPALLRSLAEDPYATARANAAWALGQVGGPGVVAQLRRALDDSDTWVRLRALTALGRLNAREAIDDVRRMQRDPNSMVRERAREVLRRLEGRQ